MTTLNKRLVGIVLAATILLLIPFTAMQFTDEVQWSPSDFIVAAVLLFGTGLICEIVLRNVNKTAYRILICAAVLAALLIVWTELAVGVFGTRFAGS